MGAEGRSCVPKSSVLTSVQIITIKKSLNSDDGQIFIRAQYPTKAYMKTVKRNNEYLSDKIILDGFRGRN